MKPKKRSEAQTYVTVVAEKGELDQKPSIKPISLLSLMLTVSSKSVQVDRDRRRAFGRTLRSLVNQGLPHWEWLVAVRSADLAMVSDWLTNERLPEKLSVNVRLIAVDDNEPSIALAQLSTLARGDWAGICFVGDAFAPHFVYELLRVYLSKPAAFLIYFDDDVIKNPKTKAADLNRHLPQFKPEFSLDLLLSRNYIGLSFVTKKALLCHSLSFPSELVSSSFAAKAKGGVIGALSTKPELNFPYQLMLRCLGQVMPDRKVAQTLALSRLNNEYPIIHVAQVLRHRDLSVPESVKHEQSAATLISAKRCMAGFLQGLGRRAKVRLDEEGFLKIDWPLPRRLPKVSIIVPTKDQFKILKICVDSLIKKTQYPNFELIIVDNQTTEPEALAFLSKLEKNYKFVTVLKYDKPFNFSDINNWAADVATGEVLVLMNNDVEVMGGGWLRDMVMHAVRDDVGCVGAKLLFPDRTIQHGGVAVGIHGVADHMYRSLKEGKHNDPYGNLRVVRNPLAVTAAVLAIRRSLFKDLGGFDAKRFKVAFNDVDLCLKAETADYRTVWTPEACLIHHESKTRAPRTALLNEIGVKARATERQEVARMKRCWGGLLKRKQKELSSRFTQLRVF